MGACEKPVKMRRPKYSFLALLTLLGVAICTHGCQGQATPTLPPTKQTIVDTLTQPPPTSTGIPSLTPSLTQTPDPTPTTGPQIDLDGHHPEVSYSIPLNSQRISETSAILYFVLDQTAEGHLFYGPTSHESFTNTKQLDDNEFAHLIHLEDLSPGTSYHAAVGLLAEGDFKSPLFAGDAWDPIDFHTLEAESTSVSFGVMGDSGFGEQVTYQLVGGLAGAGLDFVIHTGDLVYRVEEHASAEEAFQQKYYLPFSDVLHDMPVFAVLGNHEYDAAAEVNQTPYYFLAFPQVPGWTPQSDLERREYYAYEIGNVQFLFLDTQDFWRDPGDDEQTNWLLERLKDDRFSISIPVFHVPPFSSGLHRNDGIPIERSWAPIFAEYNVPLVLSGHDHNYQRLVVDGTTYVISGGGSGVVYTQHDPHPGEVLFSARSHYLIATINSDGIELRAISSEGEIIDEVLIEIRDDV